MKIVIAGSRNINDYDLLLTAVEKSGFDITSVISGTASGADRLGERYAEENNITLIRRPADWKKHGKAAGHIRNAQMADEADAAIILWDGYSNGTKGMIREMAKRNKPCKVTISPVHFALKAIERFPEIMQTLYESEK
jgi:hypothetical protein